MCATKIILWWYGIILLYLLRQSVLLKYKIPTANFEHRNVGTSIFLNDHHFWRKRFELR